MAFLKKYPIFTAVCLVLALGTVAGIITSYNAYSRLVSAEKGAERALAALRSIESSVPSPVNANLEAIRANVVELENAFNESVAKLRSERVLTLTSDPTIFLPVIQRFIRDFTLLAEQNTDFAIKPEEAFGFSAFVGRARTPTKEITPALDKQRIILTYLLQKLVNIASEESPVFLTRVARQHIELPEARRDQVLKASARVAGPQRRRIAPAAGDHFEIDPVVSGAVPGAIDTVAFELRFVGFTESLRRFLEDLVSFELPVVVRSIEVARFEDLGSSDSENASGSPLASLLSPAPNQPDRRPILDKNQSEFIVILEYVEVKLND